MGCTPSVQVTDCQDVSYLPQYQSIMNQKEINSILENEASWDFDIFALEQLTCKRPLQYLAMKTFQRFNVFGVLRCSEQVMVNWLQCIEVNYESGITYHNSTHAADVLHAIAYFLSRPRIQSVMDDVDVVASLLAAIVHDVGHRGRTNAFLINSNDPLAVLYNDNAVLENHHVGLAFQLTSKYQECNIFANLDRDSFRTLGQMIIDTVLSTDMKMHFDHLSKFRSDIANIIKSEEAFNKSLSPTWSSSLETHLSSAENKRLIKSVMMKCADISNPCRPFEKCKEWTCRICGEYWSQTAEEQERGLPVSLPMYDRKNCNIAKTQSGFIDFLVRDLYQEWHCLCDIPELMNIMQFNYNYWKDLAEAFTEA